MSMHEKPTETIPMTEVEKLAQVVNNPESIVDPVDADLAKLHKRLASSRTPEVPAPTPEGVSAPTGVTGKTVHTRGGAADGESYFGQLANEMVKVNPTLESAASTGRTGPIDSQTIRGRRSKGRAVNPQTSAVEKPITPEKEPIQTGKYLDSTALLCEVYEQGGDFSYKVLEGEDEGQIIPVGDESRMRALMGDEWKKVDDATVPNLIESAEPAEVTGAGLEQQEQLEGYELEKGQMWIREIEFKGKKGHERIFIESISGDDVQMFREREFVGSQPWEESFTSSVPVMAKKFHDEGFTLGNKPLEKAPVIPKTDPELPPVDAEMEKPTVDIELPLGEGEATPEQFLDNLPEGGSIKMKSKRGRQTRQYIKSGDAFLSEKTKMAVDRDYLLQLFKNGWTLEPLLPEVVPSEAEAKEPSAEYQELFQGDIWVMRDEQGKFMQAFAIGPIYTFGGKTQVNAFKLGEDLVIPDAPQDFEEVEQTKGIVMDLEDLRGDLARNKYVRETQGTVSEKNIENRSNESHFVHLENIGDEAVYVRKKDFLDDEGLAIVKVKRTEREQGGKKVQGYLIADAAVGTKFVALNGIEAIAQAEGWIPFESADTLPLEKTPEMPKFFEEVDKEKSEIGELRERVELLREAYVKIDYEQETAFKKITGVLRFLTGRERNDKDTEEARQAYEQALMNLQEAELAEIKASGLSGVFLKERMAGMLHYYKFSERVNIYNDRLEIEAQQKKWPQKAWDVLESVGKKYNALPPKVKIAIAVATLAGAGGLAFAGAAGSAAGVLAIKRVISSLAAGASLDELSKQGAEYLRKRSTSKEEEQEMVEIGALATPLVQPEEKPRTSPLDYTDPSQEGVKAISAEQQEALDRLQALVTKDILGLNKKFQNQKSEKLFRKTAVWGTAVAASSYFTVKGFSGVMEAQDGDLDQALRDLRAQVGSPASAASAPEAALGTTGVPGALGNTDPLLAYNPDLPSVNVDPEMIGQLSEPELGASAAQTAVESAPRADVTGLLKEHVVTSADGKKGLWGIFENRLPDSFEGDNNKAIQSLNNLVQQKVNGMTPEQLKEVGLRTNDISKIYPGDKIDFSKLLTREEIQSVLDGKSVAAPAVSNEVIERVTAKVTETAPQVLGGEDAVMKAAEDEMIAQDRLAHGYTPAEQAALDAAEDQMIAQSKAEELASNTVRTAAAETTNVPSNPFELKSLKVFLQENPDMIPQFKNTLIGIRQTMFETPDVSMMNPSRAVYFDYRVQPMMGKVDMLRVLEYSRDLRAGVLQEYAFNQSGGPLHSSQIRQLNHLVQVAQDPKLFGTFGRVIRGESVEEYTRRIAALATATNKTPQLAMMLTGRAPRII